MLRQYVERAAPQRRGVLSILGDRIDRHPAFQHFKAIGRHQHRARRLIKAMIGAADALHQPRGAFGRTDIDHQIDVAPINAKIERRSADHRAQTACGHGVLDLAALRDIERAVMQRDRQIVVVDAPQLLEQHLGLAAGIDEHQRDGVPVDQLIDLAERVPRRMPGPGQPLAAVEHVHDRLRRAARHHDIGSLFALTACGRGRTKLRHQKARQLLRLGHRGRQPDHAQLRRQPPQPRQPERQQIAALGGHQRVQLVQHHAAQCAEQMRRVVGSQQQRQLLRRGQQNLRRVAPLPLPARHRGIAGAGLDPDRQRHLRNRRFQIAGDIDRQRFQRRDVQGVQTGSTGLSRRMRGRRGDGSRIRRSSAQLHQGRQEPGQGLAGASRGDQQRGALPPGLVQERELMRARRPATRRKPLPEPLRQQLLRRTGLVDGIHPIKARDSPTRGRALVPLRARRGRQADNRPNRYANAAFARPSRAESVCLPVGYDRIPAGVAARAQTAMASCRTLRADLHWGFLP